MTQNFNFKVNIERLNPFTGQLLCVDRMTSDYAQAHPFDVDAYLKAVAEKHVADYQRVREFFYYPLQGIDRCPAKHRDKVVKDAKTGIGQIEFGKWPSFVNGCEPAIIEAWNEGAKFAVKGFKYGDTLPDRLPMCKITRLQDGSWIALFPKDKHLLEQPTAEQDEHKRQERKAASSPSHPLTSSPTPLPQQLDLFGVPVAHSVIDDAQDQSDHKVLKAVGITLAGVAVMAILIHTGMLIPMGLIGLAAGGMLR